MSYLLVGVGGAIGSIARYRLGKFISERLDKFFPIATFIINITGAILLGIVSNLGVSSSIYLLLADGFLGAYTTFSTFMYEGVSLFQDRRELNALVYILGTVLLGILGFTLGYYLTGIVV
jgi:CrcB protein